MKVPKRCKNVKVPPEWRLAHRVYVPPLDPPKILTDLYMKANLTTGMVKILSAARHLRDSAPALAVTEPQSHADPSGPSRIIANAQDGPHPEPEQPIPAGCADAQCETLSARPVPKEPWQIRAVKS
jgi:hypothetical protein